MIERDPDSLWLTRRFFWRPTFRHPTAAIWNRLVKMKPLLVQLNRDNSRFVVPYFLCEAEAWLLHGRKNCSPNLKAPMSVLAGVREKTLAGGRSQGLWRFLCQVPPSSLIRLYAQQDRSGNPGSPGVFDVIDMLLRRQVGIVPSDALFLSRLEAQYELRFIRHPAVMALYEAAAREYVKARESSPKKVWRSRAKRTELIEPIFQQLALISDFLDLYARRADDPDAATYRPRDEDLIAVGREWPAPDFETDGWNLVPPKGVSLQWFANKSQSWHQKMALVDAERNEIIAACNRHSQREFNEAQSKMRWDSLIESQLVGDLEIVPLTSALQLQEEGAAMHHCVGSYSSLCLGGYSRIFSIRREGKGLATVEITEQGQDRWSVRQCFGPCNASISDTEIKRAVEQLASDYSAAAKSRRRELLKAA